MKNALIIFGGVSSEHDVSLASAENVINSIPTDKYTVYKIGITKDGRWFKYDGPTDLKNSKWESHESCVSACILPDRAKKGITVFTVHNREAYINSDFFVSVFVKHDYTVISTVG